MEQRSLEYIQELREWLSPSITEQPDEKDLDAEPEPEKVDSTTETEGSGQEFEEDERYEEEKEESNEEQMSGEERSSLMSWRVGLHCNGEWRFLQLLLQFRSL